MSKKQHRHTEKAATTTPQNHRLWVGLPELTLAKRPAESSQIIELHAAVKALAREAARSDHSQEQRN